MSSLTSVVARDRQLTVVGASSLARGDIASVEIRTLSGKAILRLST